MRDFDDEKIREQAAMYALGMLSQSEAQAFESCLSGNQKGYADELASFDAVVAELGLSALELTPPERARKQLLVTVASEAETTEIPVIENLASPAPEYHSVRLDEGKWKRLAEGVFVKTLFIDREKDLVTSLVKLEPGARFPRHRHPGIEESVVILGDCHVNGEAFMPGDYRRADAGTTDGEITTINGTTYLVVASRKVEILEAGWAS
ncbi:MAG: cupin domain-containing protein [Blastocatellales bacterium]